MSARDRYLLGVVLGLVAVGAFWLLALHPKLNDLSKAKKDVASATTGYQQARAEAQQFAGAKRRFPHAYAAMARLGKSVPTNIDEAALVYQVAHAADRSGVHFDSLNLTSTDSGAAAAPPAPAQQATTATQSQSGNGGSSSGGSQAGGSSTPAPVAPAPAPPADTVETQTVGSVPADAIAAAAAPTGASTGLANLRVMHFDLIFTGKFLRLEDFLRSVKRMTWTREDQLVVSGRLFSVDSITFDSAGDKVTMSATTYLLPLSQGVFAGATPAGPAGLAAGGTEAASATGSPSATPPTATVTPR